MMSVCRNNSVNSFFGLPPPPLEEDHFFSQAFHQTLGAPSPKPNPKPTPPLTPPPPPPIDRIHAFHNDPIKPIKVLDSPPTGAPAESAGDRRNPARIDLMSCTESLGFESSDEMMSSFDDLGRSGSGCNDEESSPSSSSLAVGGCLRREKGVAKRWEERRFPPPLTSLSENGRRKFVLKSVRKEGRLEIVGVMIDHPEILCATRDNGRLRMHLVKSLSDDDNDNDNDKEEEEEEEEEEVEETAEEEEEERERRRPAAAGGMRRCYYHQRYKQMWGPQQHRYVTTI